MRKRRAKRQACQFRNPRTGMYCLKSSRGKIRSCSPTRVPGVPVCRPKKRRR